MKVAIYIEQGVTQLVLTPEGEWEKSVVAKLVPSGTQKVTAMRGSFYECRGGWIRYSGYESDDNSVILLFAPLSGTASE